MPQQNTFSFSRAVAGLAILLWLVSLALPGLVYYGDSGSNPTYGLSILLNGWIGILGTYVGWYANILWLVAICHLIGGRKPAPLTATWAAILALDTFRVDCISMGGPCEEVYGLGIGGAIWLTAIFLTLVAAAIRTIEVDCESRAEPLPEVGLANLFTAARTTSNSWSIIASIAVLIGFIGLAAALGTYDRVVGNADERGKLNRALAVFKRTEVCQLTPKPKEKILLDGPLQLVNPGSSKIVDPKTLLRKGVSVVREGAFDFFLENPNDLKSISKRAAIGEPSAWLTIHYIGRGLPDRDSRWGLEYKASLVSKDGVVGFEQDYWRQYNNVFCPSLYDWVGEHFSLAKLVLDTVILRPPTR